MNTKAFSSILILFIIFTITILVISNISITDFEPIYNNSFIQTKNKLSNYYVLTNQASQNCFLKETQLELENCINDTYNNTLNELNMELDTFYNCNLNNFDMIDANTFSKKLNCYINLESNQITLFSNEFSIDVIVKRAN